MLCLSGFELYSRWVTLTGWIPVNNSDSYLFPNKYISSLYVSMFQVSTIIQGSNYKIHYKSSEFP